MLTVAVAGAEHSISITPGVLRISRPGETFDCSLDDFPLPFKISEVKGRLSVCDSTGRMVWCWRSLARTESQVTGYGSLASHLTPKRGSRAGAEEASAVSIGMLKTLLNSLVSNRPKREKNVKPSAST